MNKLIVNIIFFFLFYYPSVARTPQWRLANGTAGNAIAAIDVYKSNPDTLYAIGEFNTIRSIDKGEHWDSIGQPRTDIGALKIDLNNSKIIYVSTMGRDLNSNDVISTTDGGATWNLLPFFGREFPVAVIEIDPSHPERIYVGIGPSDIKLSNDKGQTWTSLSTPSANYLTSLAIDPSADSILYAGYQTGIFKSTNRGASWSSLSLSFNSTRRTKIVINPLDASILYATVYSENDTTPGGIFKSTDSGNSWNEINNGLLVDDRKVNTICINPKNPDEIFIGTSNIQNPIMRSSNGGNYWEHFSKGLPPSAIFSITLDTLNSRLYCGVYSTPESSGVYILDKQINSLVDNPIEIAKDFLVCQNYPNPFNLSTTMEYSIPHQGMVAVDLFNILGEKMLDIFKGYKEEGKHKIFFYANGLASGEYIISFRFNDLISSRKIILVK